MSNWYIEFINEVTIVGPTGDSIEFKSLGIFEWDFSVVKEWRLLEMKDNIKEGDKLLPTVAFPESVYDGINVEILNWNF